MANLSISLPVDGDTIDASDYNTPITTIVNEFNGNIDSTNIKAGGVTNAALAGSITNDKLSTGASGVANAQLNTTAGNIGGAWLAWTPTVTAETGTFTTASIVGVYSQIGKTILFKVTLTITTAGTALGAARFTLPVTACTNVYIGGGRENQATAYALQVFQVSSTVAGVVKYDGTTIIANGRTLECEGFYQAA